MVEQVASASLSRSQGAGILAVPPDLVPEGREARPEATAPVRERRRRLAGRLSILVAGVVGNVVGLLLVITAWIGVSGQPVFAQQLRWINLGVAGLVLAGAADMAAIAGCRRLVWRRVGAEVSGDLEMRTTHR